MKKSRYTEEQILYALKQAEAGQVVTDVCRQMGFSEATFYIWKKRYANLGVLEVRELRQLRDENARLQRSARCAWEGRLCVDWDCFRKAGTECLRAGRPLRRRRPVDRR
jgi:putative transposase